MFNKKKIAKLERKLRELESSLTLSLSDFQEQLDAMDHHISLFKSLSPFGIEGIAARLDGLDTHINNVEGVLFHLLGDYYIVEAPRNIRICAEYEATAQKLRNEGFSLKKIRKDTTELWIKPLPVNPPG